MRVSNHVGRYASPLVPTVRVPGTVRLPTDAPAGGGGLPSDRYDRHRLPSDIEEQHRREVPIVLPSDNPPRIKLPSDSL